MFYKDKNGILQKDDETQQYLPLDDVQPTTELTLEECLDAQEQEAIEWDRNPDLVEKLRRLDDEKRKRAKEREQKSFEDEVLNDPTQFG